MIADGNATEHVVVYREIARALLEVAPMLRHPEAREELESLAVRYQRLAEYREELCRLQSAPLYCTSRAH